MEVILSQRCKSLTGTVGSGFGYYIRSTKTGRFFSQRSKHSVPPDGHWQFIVSCAEIAKNGFMLSDIKVNWLELQTALYEAKCFVASEQVRRNYADKCKATYDARDILNLKITFGL